MKLKIDREKCIGCGGCEGMYPEIFKLDDEMKSTVIADIGDKTIEELKEILVVCPVEAIEIEE